MCRTRPYTTYYVVLSDIIYTCNFQMSAWKMILCRHCTKRLPDQKCALARIQLHPRSIMAVVDVKVGASITGLHSGTHLCRQNIVPRHAGLVEFEQRSSNYGCQEIFRFDSAKLSSGRPGCKKSARQGQFLGEHQRRTKISARHSKDTAIIWYKRACVRQTRDNFLWRSKPLKRNIVIDQAPN